MGILAGQALARAGTRWHTARTLLGGAPSGRASDVWTAPGETAGVFGGGFLPPSMHEPSPSKSPRTSREACRHTLDMPRSAPRLGGRVGTLLPTVMRIPRPATLPGGAATAKPAEGEGLPDATAVDRIFLHQRGLFDLAVNRKQRADPAGDLLHRDGVIAFQATEGAMRRWVRSD